MGLDKYEQLKEKILLMIKDGRVDEVLTILNEGWKRGETDATLILGHLYRYGTVVDQNTKRAIQLYHEALDNENSIGAQILGILYENGDENIGVLAEKEKAFRYYIRASEMGYIDAFGSVARCYFHGIGTDIDEDLAFTYANYAAKQGVQEAKVILGLCYDYGVGVDRNPIMATNWYREVLQVEEDPRLMSRLSLCLSSPYNYFNVFTTEEMLEEGYYWASKAVELGSVEAHIVIAWFYETGNVVQRDLNISYKFLTLAANSGDEFATDLLKRYRKNVRGLIYLPE